MPEEVATSPSEAKKPQENLSEDGRRAWRLAAILLVCKVILGVVAVFATKSQGSGSDFGWLVALVCAYHLYHLRAGTGTAVMVFAGLGCAVAPFYYFRHHSVSVACILTAAAWGLGAALFMLLLGEARKARRITAIVTFCLFPGAFAALAIIGFFVKAR